MKIDIPKFETKEELFKHLFDNQDDMIYQAKNAVKYGDAIYTVIPFTNKEETSKNTSGNPDSLKVRAIINTTNVRDSHKDVHIPGLWKKSLQENKRVKHLQEHQMAFDKIISDKEDLKAFTKKYSWRDLGVDKDGDTEALVFDSVIKRDRNKYMYEQYKLGNVDNHSVGMRYVNIKLALNSEEEDYEKEKAVWDKHFDSILNKEEMEKDGYFWAVYEAKTIEGSAVPIGSNTITPTLQPSKSTVVEDKEAAADKALSDIFINFLKE
jgi:hypothetical protein